MIKQLMPLAIFCGVALSGVAYTRFAEPAPETATFQSDAQAPVAYEDSDADGIPDFLLLDAADGDVFRRWFTFLAEAAFYQADALPAEINDCAALLRFAFREALRKHDGAWASSLHLPVAPAFAHLVKYNYPHTPLGANLFRIRDGSFTPEDLRDGAFAQFADAKTLREHNARLISRDIRAAKAGDLIFYRQEEQRMPDHVMIYLGESHFEADSQHRVVYHTGPDGDDKGEIRRPSLDELLNHREPRWRPVPSNQSFLGVYRWRILP